MDDSDLTGFRPVPLRGRRDGWTAKKQYLLILGLARGFPVAKAAGLVGMSRKSAYQLRDRAGAEGFRAAWNAAVARANDRRFAARPPGLADRALDGEWHPRFYRGRLVGWTQRDGGMRMMGILKRLDKVVARLPDTVDPENFERFMNGTLFEGDMSGGNPCIGDHLRHLPQPRRDLGK